MPPCEATHGERLSSRLNAAITLISIPNFATFTICIAAFVGEINCNGNLVKSKNTARTT
ncbi:MAG: hypothetical protein FWB82_01255 [Treponema sp.]|nr:hypothetical protein [Treponema sp.]